MEWAIPESQPPEYTAPPVAPLWPSAATVRRGLARLSTESDHLIKTAEELRDAAQRLRENSARMRQTSRAAPALRRPRDLPSEM